MDRTMDREEEFARRDRLLVEARRVRARASAFLARPKAARGGGAAAVRLALIDDLRDLLARLNREKAVIEREQGRGDRVRGAIGAYAKAGRVMRR